MQGFHILKEELKNEVDSIKSFFFSLIAIIYSIEL